MSHVGIYNSAWVSTDKGPSTSMSYSSWSLQPLREKSVFNRKWKCINRPCTVQQENQSFFFFSFFLFFCKMRNYKTKIGTLKNVFFFFFFIFNHFSSLCVTQLSSEVYICIMNGMVILDFNDFFELFFFEGGMIIQHTWKNKNWVHT